MGFGECYEFYVYCKISFVGYFLVIVFWELLGFGELGLEGVGIFYIVCFLVVVVYSFLVV